MILLDVHAHIYDCFDLGRFFASALYNFKTQSVLRSAEKTFSGVIFLADWPRQNWFYRLSKREADGQARNGEVVRGWQINPTKESNAVRVCHSESGEGFYLVAGRKVITSENLELLALFEEKPIADGRRLKELVTEVGRKGGVPVIPWAFGKWTGKRGAALAALIDSASRNDLFLADNRNRPSIWPRPALFLRAEKRGIRILAGSDPLDFPAEQDQVGAYGSSILEELDPDFPARHLKSLIGSPGAEIQPYGRRTGIFRFVHNQIQLRLRKSKNSPR